MRRVIEQAPHVGTDPSNPVEQLDRLGVAHEACAVPPWAETLVRLLDRSFVIPGTRIPVGLDAIVGLFMPGAGDILGALTTTTLLLLALKLRVPKVVVFRMVVHVVVDALVGCVPIFGDAFDVYFRAGDRNLALLRKYSGTGRLVPGWGDYAVVFVALFTVLGLLALPILIGVSLVRFFFGLIR